MNLLLMNLGLKKLRKTLANRIQQPIDRSYTWLSWFHSREAQIVQYIHINKWNKWSKGQKSHDYPSWFRKNLWQSWRSLHNKSPKKLGIKGMYFNIIKAIFEKSIANIRQSGEKLKAFLWCQEWNKGVESVPFLLIIVLEFLARAVRQEKEMKGIQIGKEEIKLFLCRWYDPIL
jgi:hypothetical protein